MKLQLYNKRSCDDKSFELISENEVTPWVSLVKGDRICLPSDMLSNGLSDH